MSSTAARHFRNALLLIGLPAAALIAVLSLRALRPSEPTSAADAETTAAPTTAAEDGVVRLASAHIAAVAGIEVSPVEQRQFTDTIVCSGEVGFNDNKYVKVPPKTSGILQQVNVDVGSKVRAGDVLAVINSQSLGDLKARLLKATIHEEHSRWLIDRYRQAPDAVASKNVREEEHLLEEERTETERIKQRLAELGLTSVQIQTIIDDKDYGIQLPLFAPRDGVIVYRHAVEGEPVEIVDQLFVIADLNTMWVRLKTYESNLARLRLGQPLTFHPDGLAESSFTGTITWISPQIDLHTRTVEIRGEVSNRDGLLRANMYGRAELPVNEAVGHAAVPSSAVQQHNGESIVFVRRTDQEFDVRRVQIGQKTDGLWEVTSGLAPGELVATGGSFLLKSQLENPEFGSVE